MFPETFEDVLVTNDLHIMDGVFEMNPPCTLTVGNNITIEETAGLNANDGDDLFIYRRKLDE
ncbi:MAG: hypothetical protein R2750_10480 [Bacteroidales bacterium]